MHTKILFPTVLVMILLLPGCSTNKANEQPQQQAAAAPPASSPSPDSGAQTTTAQDSPTPASKLKTRPQQTPATQQTTPSDEATPTSTPTPTPTPTATPEPTPVVIPAGTTISVRTTGPISTNGSQAKQEFQASLAKPLLAGTQAVVPKGAAATGNIPTAQSAGRIKGEGALVLQLTTLTVRGKVYHVATEPVTIQAKGRGKRSAAMIGGGGAGGALIGGLAGGGKGAAIGALAGAAAGTAGATMTGKRDVGLPAETIVSFRLSRSLVLPPPLHGESEAESAPMHEQNSPDTNTPKQPGEKSQPPPSQPPSA
jgi:hypothetical protein